MSEPGELALLGSAKDGAVRTTSRGENKVAKWLVIASGKGGSGKTSASLNMAVYAAHEGLRVVVVDLDRQATLTRWYQRRPDEAPAVILWAGSMSDAAKAIREIDALDGVDLVVVDTPPGLDDHPEATRLLVEKADFVLVPTTQGTADIDSVVEWMKFLKREKARAGFMLNKVQRNHTRYRNAKLRLNRAGALCPVDVRLLDDIEATHDHGVGVCEIRKSKGAEDFGAVWEYTKRQMQLDTVSAEGGAA
jgi:chromosome partitioning protein